jgi:hypothetical protein
MPNYTYYGVPWTHLTDQQVFENGAREMRRQGRPIADDLYKRILLDFDSNGRDTRKRRR